MTGGKASTILEQINETIIFVKYSVIFKEGTQHFCP